MPLRHLRRARPVCSVGSGVVAIAVAVLAAALSPSVARAEAPAAWIGLELAPGKAGGVHIRRVMEGSPAETAKLTAGDEVLAIDGAAMTAPQQMVQTVRKQAVGAKLLLTLAGAPARQIEVTLGTRPDPRDYLAALVDKPAPEVASKVVLAGDKIEGLAALRGQVVLLDFFATWCGPCMAALPRIAALHRELGDKGLRVVGISSEEPDTVAAIVKQHDLRYSVLVDEAEDVPARYRVYALPTVVVIDREGVVRRAGVGHLDEAEQMIRLLLDAPAKVAPGVAAAGSAPPAKQKPQAKPKTRSGQPRAKSTPARR